MVLSAIMTRYFSNNRFCTILFIKMYDIFWYLFKYFLHKFCCTTYYYGTHQNGLMMKYKRKKRFRHRGNIIKDQLMFCPYIIYQEFISFFRNYIFPRLADFDVVIFMIRYRGNNKKNM